MIVRPDDRQTDACLLWLDGRIDRQTVPLFPQSQTRSLLLCDKNWCARNAWEATVFCYERQTLQLLLHCYWVVVEWHPSRKTISITPCVIFLLKKDQPPPKLSGAVDFAKLYLKDLWQLWPLERKNYVRSIYCCTIWRRSWFGWHCSINCTIPSVFFCLVE